MIVRIVRIVLRCIVFRDDGIRRQIQNQTAVSGTECRLQFLTKTHVFYHLIYHHFVHLPIRQMRKMLVGATSPNPFELQLRCWLRRLRRYI